MTEYTPTIPQAIFGQPHKKYDCPLYVEAALSLINDNLNRQMWNKYQGKYLSPFSNTGESYKSKIFEVESYDWNEDNKQPYNFKWRDFELSWYKYFGRGMSTNRKTTPKEASIMLQECYDHVNNIFKLEIR